MLMLRKFLVFLAASLLTFLLFATALSTAIILTFTPANLKTWLKDSNVYNTAVDTVLTQNKTLNTNDSSGGISLQDPVIQGAIKKTFSPVLLQSSTENIIDGTNQWLTGKVALPNFSVDLSAAKTSLAQQLGGYAQQKYVSLPPCTAVTPLPTNDTILDATCKPAGYNPAPQIQQLVSNVATSKDFLKDPLITANTLTTNNSSGQPESVFTKARRVPKAYQWARRSPIIFGILSIVIVIMIVFMSVSKRYGLRRVGISAFSVGILLLLAMWSASEGFHKINEQVTKQAANNTTGISYQGTIIKILDIIRGNLTHTLVEFGIGFIAAAVILFIILFVTRPKTPKTGPKQESDTPSPESEDKKPEEPVLTPKPPVLVQSRIPSI
jgi:hypothetical protein